MHDGSILDVYVIADPDSVNIPTDHGIKPDAAVISDDDITGKGGIVGEEAVLSEFWSYPFYGSYQCHAIYFPLFSNNQGNSAAPGFHGGS
jgi:hypothetical protein